MNTVIPSDTVSEKGLFNKALAHLPKPIKSALLATGLATTAALTTNSEAATTLNLGEMAAQQVTTVKTNPADHQEVLTPSLTFTTSTAGSITVSLNYILDGIGIGTELNQTVDLWWIIQREFTGLAPFKILDTNSIEPGNTSTTVNISEYFDRKTTEGNPLIDTFDITLPGTYTLSYRGILDSQHIAWKMNFGGGGTSSATQPIQVMFTPIPETGTTMLWAAWLAAAMLRRKRQDKVKNAEETV